MTKIEAGTVQTSINLAKDLSKALTAAGYDPNKFKILSDSSIDIRPAIINFSEGCPMKRLNLNINPNLTTQTFTGDLKQTFYKVMSLNDKTLMDDSDLIFKLGSDDDVTKAVNLKFNFPNITNSFGQYLFNYLKYLDNSKTTLLNKFYNLFISKDFKLDVSGIDFNNTMNVFNGQTTNDRGILCYLFNSFVLKVLNKYFKRENITDDQLAEEFKKMFEDPESKLIYGYAQSSQLLPSILDTYYATNIYSNLPKMQRDSWFNLFSSVGDKSSKNSMIEISDNNNLKSKSVYASPENINNMSLWDFPFARVKFDNNTIKPTNGETRLLYGTGELNSKLTTNYKFTTEHISDKFNCEPVAVNTIEVSIGKSSLFDISSSSLSTTTTAGDLTAYKFTPVAEGTITINPHRIWHHRGWECRIGEGSSEEVKTYGLKYYDFEGKEHFISGFDLPITKDTFISRSNKVDGDGAGGICNFCGECSNEMDHIYSNYTYVKYTSENNFPIHNPKTYRYDLFYKQGKTKSNKMSTTIPQDLNFGLYSDSGDVRSSLKLNNSKHKQRYNMRFKCNYLSERTIQKYINTTLNYKNYTYDSHLPKCIIKNSQCWVFDTRTMTTKHILLGNYWAENQDKQSILDNISYYSNTNTDTKFKFLSANYARLKKDIAMCDERITYLMQQELNASYKQLSKILEVEILNEFNVKPYLLTIYRSNGYLNYAVSKLADSPIWCNLENPLGPPIIHADNTNLIPHMTYCADNLNNAVVVIQEMKFGEIIKSVITGLEFAKTETLSSIDNIYQQLFKGFGNLKYNESNPANSIPGIFISNEGNAQLYLTNLNLINVVSVNEINPVNDCQNGDGIYILFIPNYGDVSLPVDYIGSKSQQEAIKTAGLIKTGIKIGCSFSLLVNNTGNYLTYQYSTINDGTVSFDVYYKQPSEEAGSGLKGVSNIGYNAQEYPTEFGKVKSIMCKKNVVNEYDYTHPFSKLRTNWNVYSKLGD